MKKKTLMLVLGFVVVLGVGVALAYAFDLPTKMKISSAITDIKMGREGAKARQTLIDVGDRALVLEKLKEACHDEGDTVSAKTNLLITLTPQYFNQPRAIRRALDSDVAPLARAAAWLSYGAAEHKDRCAEISYEWLKEKGADSRTKAVLICRRLKTERAIPILLEILDVEPENTEEVALLRQSLAALKEFKPKGLADKLLALAERSSLQESVRATALDALASMDDAPRELVQKKALAILKDKSNTVDLRGRMPGILRHKNYANQEVWDALKAVLVDREDDDTVTQRGCLSALATHAPIDWIKNLLLDKRVYRHRYYAVRIDVANGLATLNERSDVALQIMAEYLVDEDPKDTRYQVREAGWLALWQLTGVMYGVKERDLFERAPQAITDPQTLRDYLLRSSLVRRVATQKQMKALQAVTGKLGEMQKIREVYLSPSTLGPVKDRWAKEREAAAPKKKPAGDKEPIEPVGPQPPKKGD